MFSFYTTLIVYETQVALIYNNGRLVDTVGAGKYRLWGWHRHTAVFDIRTTSVTIPCQEILTKDHVPVRITVAVTYEICDPVKANHVVEDYQNQLYMDVQLALREHVAELTFDELLEQKSLIGEALRAAVEEPVAIYGVSLKRTGVKDVTMPGNVREMMLKKVEAEKSAQASLIRAREEVAATRSRVNVARMIVDNPAVLRLKELETMSEVAKASGNTIVFAGRSEIDGRLATAVTGN